MGRQAYGIVGGIIGAVVVGIVSDGTATAQGYEAGFAIGAAIGGIAGSYIDPIIIQGNKVGDNKLQVAAEGGARAIVYGRACVTSTCIIARGNRKVVKKKQSNGKGSSGSTANEYVYWTFAIGLGEAMPGASISRIWQDDNLVYDVLNDGAISAADNRKFAAKFKFYNGSETQLPDPDLQVFLGADTPYFRGTAYVVFPNFDLTQTAERIPQFKFEILQGVAGIVDELETLSWNLPGNGPGLTPVSQSVTLTANPSLLLDIDLYFSGQMETRDYINATASVGGYGRFVTATNSAAAALPQNNIYKVTIDNPSQTYYVNNSIQGETGLVIFQLDGSSAWRLSIQVAGNATITYSADPVDGYSTGPQYGTAKADITSIATGGNDTIALSTIIEDVLLKSGMTSDQFDVSALTDQVAGVCIQDTTIGAAAVNSVLAPFFFDPSEKDGKLIFVRRGAAVVRTLTIDDLTEDPSITTRQNVIEYPMKLSFFYESPATGYATTKATSYRYSPQADVSGEGSVTAPVTFYTSDQPAQIAQKLHKVAWAEAEGSFQWRVGSHCIDLLPGDCVGLYLRGISTRARITAIENDGNTLLLTMQKDRQSAYTSYVTGIPLPAPTAPQPVTMSQAVIAVMDIPALQDADDALVYYVAMSGSSNVWSGGQLQRSIDGGATWTAVGEVTTDATMGKLTVAMTAASSAYPDTTNTVTVQLFDSGNELVAQSDTTFNQEQGAIAVQLADGTWELMQYRDLVDGGNGLYTLSHLKRGCLTTTPGAHAVGALFVKLDQYTLKLAAESAWIGGTIQHRGVSYGETPESATVVSTTYNGESQLEWSVASATAQYDTRYVLVSSIIPRYRFGTEVSPQPSVNFTGYLVICSDGTHTVSATLAKDKTSVYVDCSSIGTVTLVTIYETNRITGNGAPLSLTVQSVAAGSLAPTAIVNGGGS